MYFPDILLDWVYEIGFWKSTLDTLDLKWMNKSGESKGLSF